MSQFSTYIGLDVHKNSIAFAAAPADPSLPVMRAERLPADLTRLLRQLEPFGAPHQVKICYEAGPTGYWLVRELRRRGYDCDVVAPSMSPKMPADRVKTDRKDAKKLAVFLRSGHLKAIRVPTEEEEDLRDLIRAREDFKRTETNLRRRLGALMLRHGRIWRGGKCQWTKKHFHWLDKQTFDGAGTREAKQLYLDEIRHYRKLLQGLDRSIEELAFKLERADLVRALCAFRGIQVLTAATIVAEIGDFKRFPTASKFMSFLGLTPSEFSSGDRERRGRITKAGNRRLRRLLVESAWANRSSPHVGPDLKKRSISVSEKVRDQCWTAQKRLYKRKWVLSESGKGSRKVTVALARELAGFIWAVAQEEELITKTA